jgi:hypothetical protein
MGDAAITHDRIFFRPATVGTGNLVVKHPVDHTCLLASSGRCRRSSVGRRTEIGFSKRTISDRRPAQPPLIFRRPPACPPSGPGWSRLGQQVEHYRSIPLASLDKGKSATMPALYRRIQSMARAMFVFMAAYAGHIEEVQANIHIGGRNWWVFPKQQTECDVIQGEVWKMSPALLDEKWVENYRMSYSTYEELVEELTPYQTNKQTSRYQMEKSNQCAKSSGNGSIPTSNRICSKACRQILRSWWKHRYQVHESYCRCTLLCR